MEGGLKINLGGARWVSGYMSRSFSTVSKFVGLFYRGSLGHNQYSTGLFPLPVSVSLHHLRIQQTNKARVCQYFFKGLYRRPPCGSLLHGLRLYSTISLYLRLNTLVTPLSNCCELLFQWPCGVVCMVIKVLQSAPALAVNPFCLP